ncbi:MAG: DNA gyrase inhibitor YacG [Planctomycetaceae bacterium]|nr:DNA gyrase inhibitor YacG [Planctomycetaceae bacterium]
MKNLMSCSICGNTFSEDSPEVAMPFCSQRCKLLDASRWLGEEYGLPIEDEESIQQPQEFSENHS